MAIDSHALMPPPSLVILLLHHTSDTPSRRQGLLSSTLDRMFAPLVLTRMTLSGHSLEPFREPKVPPNVGDELQGKVARALRMQRA